jgi:hypothetical protein
MRIRGYIWLVVLFVIAAAGEGFGYLLIAQGLIGVGQTVRWVSRLAVSGWLVFGLIHFQDRQWVQRLTVIALMSVAAGLGVLFNRAIGSTNGMLATAGVFAMVAGFYLGTVAIRAVLSPGIATLGVARTLIDEAMRMKLPLLFIMAALVLVPVLPLAMDPAENLQYRLQSFLSWSLIAVSLLLSLMTVFLSVGSVTREISRGQIYLTLTKPISRAQYLLGKWLGVALLNLLLVAVTGTGIYVFTVMLARQPATSAEDRTAAQQQVLTARRTISPIGINPAAPNPPGFDRRVRERLAELQRQDPAMFGDPGTPASEVSREARARAFEDARSRWFTVGPRDTKAYTFTGLGDVRGQTLQLRLKPQAGNTVDPGRVHLRIEINGRLYRHPVQTRMAGDNVKLPARTFQVLDVSTDRINDQGELVVAITNPTVFGQDQPSIHFNTTDGLQVLHQVASFEMNFARGLAMIWMRLCFVGALGVAAGSMLGFPVASVLCLLVYLTALTSGYLVESLSEYAAIGDSAWSQPLLLLQQVAERFASGDIWQGIKVIVSLIGSGFMLLIPSFDQYSAAPLISEGKEIAWRQLGDAVLWVGLIWSGAIALLGYLVFRRRELAQVTV